MQQSVLYVRAEERQTYQISSNAIFGVGGVLSITLSLCSACLARNERCGALSLRTTDVITIDACLLTVS
jgi:hypothetical protein